VTTSATTANRLSTALARTHEIDGALNTAVNQLRHATDPTTGAAQSCAAFAATQAAADSRVQTGTAFTNVFFPTDPGLSPPHDISNMSCSDNSPAAQRANTRDVTITACTKGQATDACPPTSGSGEMVGQIRIVFNDQASEGGIPTPSPGYLVNVCDWQITPLKLTYPKTCAPDAS
jgi:hypothetical protein